MSKSFYSLQKIWIKENEYIEKRKYTLNVTTFNIRKILKNVSYFLTHFHFCKSNFLFSGKNVSELI